MGSQSLKAVNLSLSKEFVMTKRYRFILSGMVVLLFTFIPKVSVFSQNNETAKFYISGGIGLGTFSFPYTFDNYDFKVGLLNGLGLSFDYTLPMEFPLSIGIGVDVMQAEVDSKATTANLSPKITMTAIMARAAWHPDLFHNDKIDTYLLAKLGFAFGGLQDTYEQPNSNTTEMDVSQKPAGLAVGLDVGMRYFFGNHFGIFTEIGFDGIFANFKAKARWKNNGWTNFEGLLIPQKYLTLGITWKW